jgi:hypothetical protein
MGRRTSDTEPKRRAPRWLFPFACVTCRRAFKKPPVEGQVRRCPICGGPAVQLSRKFKPPPQTDIEQWRKVDYLIAHGFRFESVHDPAQGGEAIRYPETLAEARGFALRYPRCVKR